jgi:hypothetical protein
MDAYEIIHLIISTFSPSIIEDIFEYELDSSIVLEIVVQITGRIRVSAVGYYAGFSCLILHQIASSWQCVGKRLASLDLKTAEYEELV